VKLVKIVIKLGAFRAKRAPSLSIILENSERSEEESKIILLLPNTRAHARARGSAITTPPRSGPSTQALRARFALLRLTDRGLLYGQQALRARFALFDLQAPVAISLFSFQDNADAD
jgi:hypothetical protein